MTAGRVKFRQMSVCSTQRFIYMMPVNGNGNCFPSTVYRYYSFLKIHSLNFSLYTVNLIPNYKIISNPTTFAYKTLLPRVIIFNSLFLASTGGRVGREKEKEAKGKQTGKWEGRRKFANCRSSFRDRDKQLDIHFLHLPSTNSP